MSELSGTLDLLATALETAGVRYLVGGSVASSARGVLRATMDVDLLAELTDAHIPILAGLLGPDWYADIASMREALRRGRPFNLIHMLSGQKFDVFPCLNDFHRSELERATPIALAAGAGERAYPVATAEDILLAKLVWYRQGGEVSERQWRDVGGLVESSTGLDWAYLDRWASLLRVDDLLDRIRSNRR